MLFTQSKTMRTVTLRFFADLECPSTAEAYPLLRRLSAHFGPRLRVEFRHFPMSDLHPDALGASWAAEAAALQDRFDEMVSELFLHQSYLSREDLLQYAMKVGLDEARFRNDIESERVAAKVRRDLDEGERTGVLQTPAFFVNQEKIDEDWSYSSLKRAIERALASGAPSLDGKKAA